MSKEPSSRVHLEDWADSGMNEDGEMDERWRRQWLTAAHVYRLQQQQQQFSHG